MQDFIATDLDCEENPEIDFSGIEFVTDECMVVLCEFTNQLDDLTSINLSGCWQLTDGAFAPRVGWKKCASMEEVNAIEYTCIYCLFMS